MTKEERQLRREQQEHIKAMERASAGAGRGPIDVPFLLLVLLLTGIGLLMMFSASFPSAFYEHGTPFYFLKRQIVFVVMGLVGMALTCVTDYARFRGIAKLLLIFSIILLAVVFVPKVGAARNNATRWIGIPGTDFQFQPSEVTKLGVIIYFADSISRKKDSMRKNTVGVFPFAAILAPIIVLLAKQPHFSCIVLICGIAAVMMYVGGIRGYWVAIGMAIALTVWLLFKYHIISYNSARIDIWLDPLNEDWKDGPGYQIRQSMLSIGSGGLLGVGFGRSRQKYRFLPEEHNDFIFAIVCEELGLIGAVLIMALFSLLIIRGYWIALRAHDRFGSMMVVGIITQIALQVALNIAVVSNFIPNTGISLPFFSYGGTALAIQLVEMGIVLTVSRGMRA